ncbi:MAG: peptidoglycan DD-metalloendopeptidase family protein [Acidobacteria bacterium]|nr:peptidoglycan DD-metalloendopeptidase family protein [Acidobacteriota bacterium]
MSKRDGDARRATCVVLVFWLAACGGSSPVAPLGENINIACLARASFSEPAESDYVLPYPVGDARYVSQSYCFERGGHINQLAYDFDAPIGATVVAARAGSVIRAEDAFEDVGTGTTSELNFLHIEHADGTVAFYAHLQQGGIVVEVGQFVDQGEPIATSGNSGSTGDRPHLHFQVLASAGRGGDNDIPVNFRNADGPLDDRRGLRRGITYRASRR